MPDLTIHPETTALVLMDYQHFVLENFLPTGVPHAALAAAGSLIAATRRAASLAIHVTLGFRPGYPEVDPRNGIFTWLKDSGLVAPDKKGVAIWPTLTPAADEPVVTKHRIGAFHGTDLDLVLRAKGIDTLILAGVTTSGVVMSTLRQAFDLDYRLIIARDACVDGDESVHHVLMEKVIPSHAEVRSVAEIVAVLDQT